MFPTNTKIDRDGGAARADRLESALVRAIDMRPSRLEAASSSPLGEVATPKSAPAQRGSSKPPIPQGPRIRLTLDDCALISATFLIVMQGFAEPTADFLALVERAAPRWSANPYTAAKRLGRMAKRFLAAVNREQARLTSKGGVR